VREIGFIVKVRVPDTTTTEAAAADLHSSIAFGNPLINVFYFIDNVSPSESAEAGAV
jgi:hypothetical protein